MNPLSINPLVLLAGAALAAAAGFGTGWQTNGWRLEAEIAGIKATHSDEKASQASQTVTDMKRDAEQIHGAATAFLKAQQAIGPKFDALKKEMHDAKALPPDCRPDDRRVRNLDAAIDAANAAAAAGRQPGSTLP